MGFALLVWLPREITHPHLLGVWSESAENFAIMGAAWVVADYLGRRGAPPVPAVSRAAAAAPSA
jgi:hypothetical protein